MARVACRLGAIDKDLQELFGVCEKTLHNWRNKHPDFKQATEAGKASANQQVIDALFKRATGCVTTKEALTKHGDIVELRTEHPPETAACMSWLYNRCRDDWKKDPEKIDGPKEDGNTYNITIVKPDDSKD